MQYLHCFKCGGPILTIHEVGAHGGGAADTTHGSIIISVEMRGSMPVAKTACGACEQINDVALFDCLHTHG